MIRGLVFALAVALSLTGAFYVGKNLGRGARTPSDAYRVHGEASAEAARTLGASNDGAGPAARRKETGVFVRVADRLKPSVVTIQCLFRDRSLSGGTGVVVTRDGFILTNNHVVERRQESAFGGRTDDVRPVERPVEMRVELSSHDVYSAQLVGADPATDLALLKIEVPEVLVPAEFGDSDDLAVGEEVVAIGNALDFGWTVTQGIVSSLHRSNLSTGREGQYTDYIQTDAAINPGNSGGPLADLRGEVIGINVAVLANRADGIGFAIPANDARFVAEQLRKNGKVVRGYLGMEGRNYRDLENAARRALGPGIVGGARVSTVLAGSPADRAGFRVGDFIYALDGRPVEDYEVLRNRVARLAPGSEVEAAVRRDGADLRIRAAVGRRPD